MSHIISIALLRNQSSGQRQGSTSFAATRLESIARGVSPWITSCSGFRAATRRQFLAGETDAPVIWKPLLSPDLQHEESYPFHHRRNPTETLRVLRWNSSKPKRAIGGSRWNCRPCSFACISRSASVDCGHASGLKEQLIGLDPRGIFRPASLCVAVWLWGFFGKFLGTRFGSQIFGKSKRTSRERIVSRRVYQVPSIARIGIRRTLCVGLTRDCSVCRPVGAWMRACVRFQGLTPLAIDLCPFGTEKIDARRITPAADRSILAATRRSIISRSVSHWNTNRASFKAATRRQDSSYRLCLRNEEAKSL